MARNIFHRTTRVARISGTKRTYDGEAVFEPITVRNECDTHADTCCAGSSWELMELTDIECEVSGFSPELGVHNKIPVATVVSLWVNPADRQNYNCRITMGESC